MTAVQAQEMLARARKDTDFPVTVNDLVLKELNRYVGTAEGRDFMRLSLLRMENYRTLVGSKIKAYQVPIELMAIPIIESGYRNFHQSQHKGWGAGIWMFIASTARTYGLRVDEQTDERLNETLLTDVAMRYLKSNELRFQDWLLSIMAYNMGEVKLEKAMRETGSRDAWQIVRAGYENDKTYLAKIMAAILIMKNPESVAL